MNFKADKNSRAKIKKRTITGKGLKACFTLHHVTIKIFQDMSLERTAFRNCSVNVALNTTFIVLDDIWLSLDISVSIHHGG